MTEYAKNALIERIRSRFVEPPDDLTASELGKWLMGYLRGQLDAIDEIDEFLEEQKI